MWDNDEETVVAYHSHTHTEPRPSPSDVKIASELGEPQAHYVVLGTSDPEVAEIRSFRIVGDDVTEEPIEVTGAPEAVQSYKFAHTPDSTVYDCS
jgi:proteasome lid subunit RPN8/RPN11